MPLPRFCSRHCGSRGAVHPTKDFWSNVEKTANCWPWTGWKYGWGYGRFTVGARRTGDRRNVAAHRYSWELANGPIPEGLHVLHKCDNPPCVRPEHLFLGTNDDNIADRIAKGRYRGEKVVSALLTEEQVREVRSLVGKVSQAELARRLGVTHGAIQGVVHRRTWRHVG